MKVGDYVRTKDGIIGKLQIKKENIAVANWNGDYELEEKTKYIINDNIININDIIKSSPNIKDLIEVGDYVNGCPVLLKENNELVCGLLLRYKEENIENIVTKEQFESMKYEVGE